MRERIKCSQNFLTSRELVRNLLEKSSVSQNDTVLEIGAGQGIITQELLSHAKKVITFEVDRNLYGKLRERFKDSSEKLEVIPEDFLDFSLPTSEYKIFANPPFNIISGIIKKLIFSANSPLDTYLVIQKEASLKFGGLPLDNKNSLMATLIKTQFAIEIFHKFKREDFYPIPSVEIVMMRIKKLHNPPISGSSIDLYRDFVAYTYSQFQPDVLKGLSQVMRQQVLENIIKMRKIPLFKKPTNLETEHWVLLFEEFLQHSNKDQKEKVKGFFKKLQGQQNKLQKSHRTRLDKNWKIYSHAKRGS